MKYKGTLIVVKDCNHALSFYRDMFGFQLLQDNDGNMELTNNLYHRNQDRRSVRTYSCGYRRIAWTVYEL